MVNARALLARPPVPLTPALSHRLLTARLAEQGHHRMYMVPGAGVDDEPCGHPEALRAPEKVGRVAWAGATLAGRHPSQAFFTAQLLSRVG